ncbi:hypothetical protein COS16_01085 [Candidatus Desantisbacteria bacterium CG02_land_8_20_14_3_00_49_13]|nr:MAG: hypothetical protein AUJ67_03985 [Candidatus Desantisbacteria bacterium CG1_02_49_89]PIV57280.1 MAG: hypothetical protein COS16_01085 [Candidatus Desantisbacteria bacterium CG02_land_8_20_14_3_00_49_13]
MPTELNQILVKGEHFYHSFSFDIDDFIGDGIWWLQIYNNDRSLIYDKPFASSMGDLNKRKVRKIINEEF